MADLTKELPYKPGPIGDIAYDIMACFPPQGVLHRYMWWASQTTDTPPWFHVGSGLALLAHQACARGYIVGDDDFQVVPNIWAAILGPSGHGKSTALRRAQKFYKDVAAKRQEADPFVNAEGSMEGLFEALTDYYDPDRDVTAAILYREEFARLLEPQRRDGVSAMFCEIADGVEVKRHLRGARAAERAGQKVGTKLKNPKISAIFATTYSALRRTTTADHLEGGLFSRFLFFADSKDPEKLKLHPTDRPDALLSAQAAWLEWLKWFDAQEALGEGTRIHIPPEVHDIIRESLFEDLRIAIRKEDVLNPMRSRGITFAYAVAGLFALSCGRLTVTGEDADCAVNLIERSLQGIAGLAPELGTSELMQKINQAFTAVKSAGDHGLPKRSIYKIARGSKKLVDLILETLIDEGSIKQRETPKTGKAGRPPILYVACGRERYGKDAADAHAIPATIIRLSAHRKRKTPEGLDEPEGG
jgi:hypothetical protein